MKMKKLLAVLIIMMPFSAPGQKILQLETRRVKATKFYIGEEITFKLKDDPLWYTRYMYDFIPSTQSVVISNNRDTMHLPLSFITHILNPYKGKGWHWPSRLLIGSGLGIMLSAVVYDVFNIGPSIKEDPVPLQVGGAQVMTGFAVKKLLADHKKMKLRDNRRLRIIDLTFYPPATETSL